MGSEGQGPATERLRLEVNRRWKGVVVEKWFGGGHGKPFKGKVTEVWKDDKGRKQWYAHILYEDDDEEDVELSEALELVVNKQKKEELAEDVERLQNKKKRSLDSSGGGGGGKKAKTSAGKAAKAEEGGKKKAGPGKRKGSKGGAAPVEDEARRDHYLEAIRRLIEKGDLEPGVGKVEAKCGEASVTADLKDDGRIFQPSTSETPARCFTTAEDFAATAFPNAAAADITITIDGKSLESLEAQMTPRLNTPPGAEQQVDEDTVRRWLEEMSEAVSSMDEDDEEEDDGRGGETLKPRAASVSTLKDILARISSALNQERQEGEGPVSEAAVAADNAFGSELARLRWLVQLHAKIERRLQRLLDATGEQAPCLDEEGQLVQAEVARSLRVSVPSELGGDQRSTPLSFGVAQLTDLRYQLVCMVRKARQLLSRREKEEHKFLVCAKQSYDCQRRILEDILAHKRAVNDTMAEREGELQTEVVIGEQEVAVLEEALELKKKQLEGQKAELQNIQTTNGTNSGLLMRKTQRWKDMLDETGRQYSSSQRRAKMIEAVWGYLESLPLERPIESELQAFLTLLSADCLQAYDQHAYVHDRIVRSRIRLAYEYFTLVQRLWSGEVKVAADKEKLKAVFKAVWDRPEADWRPWHGMPLPQSINPDGSLPTPTSVLRVVFAPPADGSTSTAPTTSYRLVPCSSGEAAAAGEEGEAVEGARLTEKLGYKTMLLAMAGSSSSQGKEVFLDTIKAGLAGLQEQMVDADSRPVRVVVFDDEAVRLPVPALLLDCLLLVHSQDYLAVIAKAAQASTTTAPMEVDQDADESEEAMVVAAALETSDSETAPVQSSASRVRAALAAEVAATDVIPPVTAVKNGPWWWEELTDTRTGQRLQALTSGEDAFAKAVCGVALVCKAVDAVLMADPPTNDAVVMSDPNFPSTHAVVCLETAGLNAGRYGAPLKYLLAHTGGKDERHLINYAAVAVSYARISWAVRRVAVIDVGRTLCNGTLNLLTGDTEAFVACLHTDKRYVARLDKPTGIVQSLVADSKRTPSEALRSLMKDKVVKELQQFEPDLILLSTSMGRGLLTAEDVELVCSELAKLAQRCCHGRLVVVLDGSSYLPPQEDKEEEDGEGKEEREGQEGQPLSACLKALRSVKAPGSRSAGAEEKKDD